MCKQPYESEDLNMNAKSTKLRFPHHVPPGCRRWEAFQALFSNRKTEVNARKVEEALDMLQPLQPLGTGVEPRAASLRDVSLRLGSASAISQATAVVPDQSFVTSIYTAQENETPRLRDGS